MKTFKRLFSVLFAATLIFGVAGNAAAYYDLGSLILSFYAEPNGDKTDNEVGVHMVDTGLVPTSTITSTLYYDITDVTLDDFNTTDDWADVNLGVWGIDTQNNRWVATANNDFGDFVIASNTQIIQAGLQVMNAGYLAADSADGTTDGKAVISTGSSNSYDTMFNETSYTPGLYANFNGDTNNQIGEISLADLATIGYVDMYLWYADPTIDEYGETIANAIGILRIGIDSNDNMYAELRAVPIPGAVVLLGSGLLGLVGIRRRHLFTA